MNPYVVGIACYGTVSGMRIVTVIDRDGSGHDTNRAAASPVAHHAILEGVDRIAAARRKTVAPVEVYVCQKSVAQACDRALEGRGDATDDAHAVSLRAASVTVQFRKCGTPMPFALIEALRIAGEQRAAEVSS